MLISALAEVKRKGGEHRTLKLYGQERNHMTASIARMNLVLHGVEDFEIARGDTLAAPAFHEGDRLKPFDVVLANPPYSIKQWNREAWTTDPWGRNFLGTPPQGRADYAFFQHILKSMDPKTGRCAILFPHGVLFRKEEEAMRAKTRRGRPRGLRARARTEPLLQLTDGGVRRLLPLQEAAHEEGQGAAHRRGERGLARAGDELPRPEHQQRIEAAYDAFVDAEGFAKVATIEEIAAQGYSLSIPLYVKRNTAASGAKRRRGSLAQAWAAWEESGRAFWTEMDAVVDMLDGLVAEAPELAEVASG